VTTDKELLKLARKFDPVILADIYDTFSPGIYRYAMRLTGDQDLAEECVAETFSRLLQAFNAMKGPQDYLQAYLFRIAHNWIVDYYRKKPLEPDLLDEKQADDKLTPEEMTGLSLQNHRLRIAILTLTPDQQQVIALKYLQGLENMEIARILKKPVGAVKSLQHRALGNLKKLLDQQELSS
jgi:RNA polymerase sigma-70 factor (ECF subfamily)